MGREGNRCMNQTPPATTTSTFTITHIIIALLLFLIASKALYFFFFTRTLSYAHSRMRSLTKYTSFDSYTYRVNCNTSPDLAGAVGSSYEDYSVTKDS